jgi:hypothetical protein
VGFIGFLTIASISDWANAIAFLKAGRKSSVLILEKGAVSYGVLNFVVSILMSVYLRNNSFRNKDRQR